MRFLPFWTSRPKNSLRFGLKRRGNPEPKTKAYPCGSGLLHFVRDDEVKACDSN